MVLGTDGVCFLCGQMIFLCSKTTFAPMISAAVLPVLLQTDTWIYPVSRCRTDSSDLYFAADQRQSGSAFERILSAIARCICRPGEKQLYTDPVHGCSQRGCASSRLEILCCASAAGGFYRNVRKIRKTGKECENRNSHHTLRCRRCSVPPADCGKADLPLAAAAFAAAVLFLLAMRTMRLWTPPAGAMAYSPA